MFSKINGLLKSIVYILLYKRNVIFANIPSIRCGAKIKCRNGIIRTGLNFSMHNNAYCAVVNGGSLSIGNNVYINRNSMIICHDNITIGNGCSIAPNVLVYDHDHKFDNSGITTGYNTAPVLIGDNCWIGGGCIILRGSIIGDGCVIGAGCVITGTIPPHSIVTMDRTLNINPIQSK